MRSRLLVIVLALAVASGNAPLPSTPRSDDLKAGISLVKEGDFEGAVVRLDAAVRSLEDSGATSELAHAYLFLGVAYLELDQEALARGKFVQAQSRAPDMRLDPAEFSPQVIRVFEATRQEALPPEANGRKAAGPPAPTGEAAEGGTRGRSRLPLIILGGAAAAGGVALASSGGGSSPTPTPSPSATPTPTPTATPTPAPTPTPTPTPEPCTFSASPALSILYDKDGGSGTCRIDASRDTCRWNAVSTQSWIQITKGTPGRGDGTINYKVLANQSDNARQGDIHLVEDPSAKCQIRQEEGFRPGARLAWTSTLQAPGASGRVALNGVVHLQGPGSASGAQELRPGIQRVEAVVTAGGGRSGVWRFRFAGPIRPGSLRVRAGEAVSVSADTIVFRLSGAPGERLAFELDARP